MDVSKEILKQYIFEVLSRIARFYIHLEEINQQFYLDQTSAIKDKVSFINSYAEVLRKLLAMMFRYAKEITPEDVSKKILEDTFKQVCQINSTINELHKELNHLPRPTEPIELRRFRRVIGKQILILTNDKTKQNNISIYVSEEIGESTFKLDPLHKFKDCNINPLLSPFNIVHSQKQIPAFKNSDTTLNNTIHITIPRIEASNPCHWPTLMHEVAHTLMKDFFTEKSISEEFNEKFADSDFSKWPNLNNHINIENWLTECWCDLLATVTFGHSFWYSQFLSFLNIYENKNNRNYPPNIFRLRLIGVILKHRFSRNLMGNFKTVFKSSEEIIEKLNEYDDIKFYDNPELRNLFQSFKIYFLEHFFIREDGKIKLPNSTLNERFQKIVKYTNEIEYEKLLKLVAALHDGLPIPSIRIENGPINIFEQPASIQDILYSAWIYRNTSFKETIVLKFISINDHATENEIEEFFSAEILKEYKRFDFSILRSIQVQEWFDLFCKNDKMDEANHSSSISISGGGPLVDHEIRNELIENRICIIPVTSLKTQLGSTSFDIRLGTSFQMFFPSQFGIIDFTEEETFRNSVDNSKKINLDYLQNITLTPGQFILGHSMEYIKLAETISADLEGRSSFARLGLEIHMTAGFVDPGFRGVLTFEIFNAGPNPIRLYPGLRIGQLRFYKVTNPIKPYSKKHSAKYSGLLEHNFSLQGLDYEIGLIKNAKSEIIN